MARDDLAHDDLDIPISVNVGHESSWRVSRSRAVMDTATKRWLLISGGVAGTLLLLVGAYSLGGHRPAGIPVIEADKRPLREKPLNAGGLEVAGADDAILGGSSGRDGMAPPPEAPATAALMAQERAATAAAARPATVPSPAPVSAPAAASAPVMPAPSAPAKPPEPARATVAARPAVTPPPATGTTAAATAGGMQVQLAALPTEQAALSEWERLSKKMPDMLATRRPAVSRTERDGKTYFRLRTGGFTDVAQATSFCQRMREKGTGCSIATF